MGKVILGMTMSLDGFVNDGRGSVGSLYPDLEELHHRTVLQESIKNTGAVVMGKRAFEMGNADWYADNYEYQVPIFVVTHETPDQQPRQTNKLTFTFVTDGIQSAIERAKIVAGEKEVTVIGGASIFQQCLRADLVDEIHVDIMPILLCSGLRLFENLGVTPMRLEKIEVLETGNRTHLRFRPVK
jgi:dihydrofolate reductase